MPSKTMQKHNYQFSAIGTPWAIETEIELSKEVKSKITQRIDEFDALYSRFRGDSAVTHLAKNAGSFTFPPDDQELFLWYEALYDATNGDVSPLVGDNLENAGYDEQYSFMPKNEENPTRKWRDILSIDKTTVKLREPAILDFGAAGKGYLVDVVAEILEESGISEYVIDASGDIRHRGKNEQIIGLEHPNLDNTIIGTTKLRNHSLCGSAANRRRWSESNHHIIDPKTGASTFNVSATWVIADTTMHADGLSTALFFTEPQTLSEKFSFQFIRIMADGSVNYSHNFEGEIF